MDDQGGGERGASAMTVRVLHQPLRHFEFLTRNDDRDFFAGMRTMRMCRCRARVWFRLWLKAFEALNEATNDLQSKICKLEGEICKLQGDMDKLERDIEGARASGNQPLELVLHQRMAGIEQYWQWMAELQKRENILLARSGPAAQGV
jgi:hypothetical protein